MLKSKQRKEIIKRRRKINQNNIEINFNKVLKLIKKNNFKKKIVGGYYPVNYEVSDLTILRELKKENSKFHYL